MKRHFLKITGVVAGVMIAGSAFAADVVVLDINLPHITDPALKLRR